MLFIVSYRFYSPRYWPILSSRSRDRYLTNTYAKLDLRHSRSRQIRPEILPISQKQGWNSRIDPQNWCQESLRMPCLLADYSYLGRRRPVIRRYHDGYLTLSDVWMESLWVDEIADSLPENNPRFVVISYEFTHADGRKSNPLVGMFLNAVKVG